MSVRAVALVLLLACSRPDLRVINTEGYPVTEAQIRVYVDLVLETCWPDADVDLDGLTIIIRSYPFEYQGSLYAGLSWPAQLVLAFGYRDPLESSALGHELGHLVLYALTGSSTHNQLRERLGARAPFCF